MRLVAAESLPGRFVIALGAEEFIILLQPGEMLRTILDRDTAGTAEAGFLLPAAGADRASEVLAALPRRIGATLLEVPAGHAVERTLQCLLFDALAPFERPPL